MGDTIGWMGEYNQQTKEFVYIAGIFATPNATVPDGSFTVITWLPEHDG